MPQDKLAALNASIKKKGFTWTASQTALSELSAREQKAHLGLVVSNAELKATEQAIKAASALMAFDAPAIAAPAAIDWRNNNGDWTTPIKDQSSCGSCVSFATCATIESRIKIACRQASTNPDLSEAHLFFCGCGNCCGSGWNFAPALDFAKNTGIGQESSFPYTPNDQPCRQVSPYIKINGWTRILAIADRKNTLASKGPMVAGMAVYADFYNYRSGVYRVTSATLRGYHAVSVVGYDDGEQCWICKNSWGTGWGDNGWFKIGYGESGMDTTFGFYDVDLTCPAPVDRCRDYVRYLVRVIRAARVNAQLRRCLLYYVCGVRTVRRPRCSRATIRVVRRVRLILMRCPRYRAPFCRALLRR